MAVSKPKTIKASTPLTKYVTGGKRSRTTKEGIIPSFVIIIQLLHLII